MISAAARKRALHRLALSLLAFAFLAGSMSCGSSGYPRAPTLAFDLLQGSSWRFLDVLERDPRRDPTAYLEWIDYCLGSEDSRLRLRALRALQLTSQYGASRGWDVTFLERRWHAEKYPGVRLEFIVTIGRLGDPTWLPFLRSVSEENPSELRAACVDAFVSCGADPNELKPFFADRSADVRAAALRGLMRWGRRYGVTRELEKNRTANRIATFESMLIDLYQGEEDERVRWSIVRVLAAGNKSDPRGLEIFERGILDRNDLLCWFALDALSDFHERHPRGLRGVEEAMARSRDAKSWWISRLAARRALERWKLKLNPEDAVARSIAEFMVGEPPRAPTIELPDMLARVGEAPRFQDSPALLDRRHVPVILEVEGKGQMVLHLDSITAPQHVRDLLLRIAGGEFRRISPWRADPLEGLGLGPVDANSQGALRPEASLLPIRRGTLVASSETLGAGFRIAGRPEPELEGFVTVIGTVVLGSRLLEVIEKSDMMTLHAYP